MHYCIVYGCPNNAIDSADPSVHYYVLPEHQEVVEQWIQAAGWSSDQLDFEIARFCSMHFEDNCYDNEFKVVDGVPCYTKVLKFDAVPTLHLPTQIIVEDDQGVNEMMLLAVSDSQEVLNNGKQNLTTSPENVEANPPKSNNELQIKDDAAAGNENKYKIKSLQKLKVIQKTNQSLRDGIASVGNSLKERKKELFEHMMIYKNKISELNRLRRTHQKMQADSYKSLTYQQQKFLLSKVFSERQIKILCGKKKIYWKNDDMAVGYTIRHLSDRRCYLHLTKNLKIPLPAVSSIKRWMTLKNLPKRRIDMRKVNNTTEQDSE